MLAGGERLGARADQSQPRGQHQALLRPSDGQVHLPLVHAEVDRADGADPVHVRSEEHTSELQSQSNLVCRLLLEKKKKSTNITDSSTQKSNLPIYARYSKTHILISPHSTTHTYYTTQPHRCVISIVATDRVTYYT